MKYKDFNNLEGPIRNIEKSDVFMIIYENGTREKINTAEPKEETQYTRVETSTGYNDYDGSYLLLAVGYGNSYGGAGMRVLYRTGGIVGVGFHAGVGYFPEAPVLGSAGIKFYPYKGLYINGQFGLYGYEETYSYNYGSNYYNYNDKELLYGPAALIGVDWTWGDKIGFGFNAGAGVAYYLNSNYSDEFDIALDIGFVIRL
ncbi:hypothetical protein [Corallibacter sp.]|uniref:hypothetical protein n=1 Tax=Corallibacter sp. TaxID=2038084 RepID=UPI003AB8C811